MEQGKGLMGELQESCSLRRTGEVLFFEGEKPHAGYETILNVGGEKSYPWHRTVLNIGGGGLTQGTEQY